MNNSLIKLTKKEASVVSTLARYSMVDSMNVDTLEYCGEDGKSHMIKEATSEGLNTQDMAEILLVNILDYLTHSISSEQEKGEYIDQWLLKTTKLLKQEFTDEDILNILSQVQTYLDIHYPQEANNIHFQKSAGFDGGIGINSIEAGKTYIDPNTNTTVQVSSVVPSSEGTVIQIAGDNSAEPQYISEEQFKQQYQMIQGF